MIVLVTNYIKSKGYIEEIYNGEAISCTSCASKEEAVDIIINGIKRIYPWFITSIYDENYYINHIENDQYYWSSQYYQDLFNENHIYEFRWIVLRN